ncbi:PQQ-binding-like beta-propeller repeat protein [Halorubellus litoreus]|uniref:PQQ-binding-like beta-propeller repeat protein n=1 Tax=Halorubellus litoreus TaxID=755308 RepID=A0ABD5V9P2_9EURY
MRRRTALGALGGVLGTAGCLRLDSSEGATATDGETATAGAATTTRADATATDEETTADGSTTDESNGGSVVDASGSVPSHSYDPANTGFADVTGPTSKPEVAWETSVASGDDPRLIVGMPTLVDGTLFTSTREGLAAVAAGSGEVRWRGSAGQAGTPTVANDRVFAGGYGATAAYVAESGDGVWSRDWRTNGVTVAGGLAFVASGDGLRAVDPASGSVAWEALAGISVGSAPAVGDGRVYVGTREGSVRAFDEASGIERWRVDVEGEYGYFIASPTYVDGVVYASSENKTCYAIDAASGSVLWEYSATGGMNPTQAVADGTVYVGHDGRAVEALDAETGDVQWTGDANTGPITVALTVDRNQVYAMDDAGLLVAYERDTGDVAWQYGVSRSPSRSAPAVVDGRVFVGGGGGRLYALTA